MAIIFAFFNYLILVIFDILKIFWAIFANPNLVTLSPGANEHHQQQSLLATSAYSKFLFFYFFFKLDHTILGFFSKEH